MTQGSSGVQRVDLGAESELVDAARALLDRAQDTDGVEAFSEGFEKELGRASDHVYWASLIEGTLTSLAACAPDGSAELVVDPDHRRNGHGTALAEAVLEARPNAGLWAHGNLPAAQGLAARLALHPTASCSSWPSTVPPCSGSVDSAPPAIPCPQASRT